MRTFKQSMVFGALSLFAFVAGTSTAKAQVTCSTVAFPGAEGAGRCAMGGRGGDVYVVTKLESSVTTPATTPGTLAYGLANAPAAGRIIVFAVSELIDLTRITSSGSQGGNLFVASNNITIAGQTAPGDGIAITGGAFVVRGNNVIVRHIRSRRGVIQTNVDHGDAFTVKAQFNTTSVTNVIIDHVSASWATDENLSIVDVTNTTAQWNINAQALNYYNASANPHNHAYGGILSGHANSEASLFHTLFAHNNRRNPHFGNYYGFTGTLPTAADAPTMDFRDNVIYDWQDLSSHTNGDMIFKINFTNNLYMPGQSSVGTAGTIFSFETLAAGSDPNNNTKMYAINNRVGALDASVTTNMAYPGGTSSTNFQVTTPFPSSLFNTVSIDNNYNDMIQGVGAILPARDIVDRTIINDVVNNAGHVIDTETELTLPDWKNYESIAAPTDSDGDGLPNFWETQFVGATLVANGTGTTVDNDTDGYVNIEEYINSTIPIAIPTSGGTPKNNVVYIGAMDSRAQYGSTTELGTWRIYRTGKSNSPLAVKFTVSDMTDIVLTSTGTLTPPSGATEGSVTIPSGANYVDITLKANASTAASKQVILELATTGFVANPSNYITTTGGTAAYPYFVGCPSRSMIRVKP